MRNLLATGLIAVALLVAAMLIWFSFRLMSHPPAPTKHAEPAFAVDAPNLEAPAAMPPRAAK